MAIKCRLSWEGEDTPPCVRHLLTLYSHRRETGNCDQETLITSGKALTLFPDDRGRVKRLKRNHVLVTE